MNGKYKAPVTSAATMRETTIGAGLTHVSCPQGRDTCPRLIGAALIWLAFPFAELEKRDFTSCQTELCAQCMSCMRVSRALWTGLMS